MREPEGEHPLLLVFMINFACILTSRDGCQCPKQWWLQFLFYRRKKKERCVASGSLCCVSRPNRAASGSGSECHLLRQVPELFQQNMWPCKLGTNYSVRERSLCCGKNDQERTLLPLDSEDMWWQPPVTWPPCWQGCCWWPPAPLDPGEWASDADDHY